MASWGGLWNNEHGAPHALLVNTNARKPPGSARLSNLLRKTRTGHRVLNELLYELTGVAAGQAALASYKQIQAAKESADDNYGGARTIGTRTLLDRVTAAADQTHIRELLTRDAKPTYPTDPSGNTGGGKLGY
ncbi:hypothetical protein HC928_00650 [bacterium]|nr:hypothetical protein [bacterium]